jgi:Tfp pilus assembly protein PilE
MTSPTGPMPGIRPGSVRAGLTLIEVLVGAVVAAIALAGAFRLWKTNTEESHRLHKKAELRDRMAIASKQLQKSVTLAGLGLQRAPTMAKSDAVGSDTLIIYTNPQETRSGVLSDLVQGQYAIHVANGSIFQGASYMVISDGTRGEVRRIDRAQGYVVVLSSPLGSAYPRATVTVQPAIREKYYTDQAESRLIRVVNGTTKVLGEDIRNFQVSFKDRTGASTEVATSARSVHFSFTGIFPAREGALSSVIFTSTAIPRNVL